MSIANNKKAFHDYDMLEEYETGIVLLGTEVKSIRAGHINLKESHIKIINSEAFLINCHISPYEQGNINNHDPLRSRKLLLNRRELNHLAGKIKEQGLTLIPLKVYIKNRRIKVSMGLAKGKKLYDKRRSLKDKDMQRDVERSFRGSKKAF
ncbi:MAG: SsrA-binding protein SmpB [Deferribacteraceae bacterium]|jgi:SsrA-binding protein|nr:SsrA-binding protein SmpB [Deferribacteraceae bacterium]